MKKVRNLVMILCLVLVIVGCSSEKYSYEETISDKGDWMLTDGEIDLSSTEGSLDFTIEYEGKIDLDESENWSCEVLVGNAEGETTIENTTKIYTRLDVDSAKIKRGNTKSVSENDVEQMQEDNLDYANVFLKIQYTAESESYTDVIRLTGKN